MTAEFNFVANSSSSNPRFSLHFKPHFGDFSIKKSHSSSSLSLSPFNSINRNDTVFEAEDNSLEMVEKPIVDADTGDYFSVKNPNSESKITTLPLKSSVERAVDGMELGAKTVLPIKNGAVLKLRWGVKIPEGFKSLMKNPTAKMSPRGIPQLVLNKIGIEHVAKEDRKVGPNEVVGLGPYGGGVSGADLAETCFTVKRQLETLRSENAVLGKALDDLKAEFGNKGFKVKEGGERKLNEIKEGDAGVGN
ncbi:uncharacterized protein LOC110734168 [Chenopodium quinoa]|nr:uncharacterized protein LOC110734168 [Chenopodium quinoa]